MYCCCTEDFKTIDAYHTHRTEHHTEGGGKPCKVCRIITLDYAKYQRTCRDCIKHGFRRCTGCNTIKDAAGFHKNQLYGKCAACRSMRGENYVPRGTVLSMMTDDMYADIYAQLDLRRQYIESDGKEGCKISFVSIARRHDIKPCNFHAWLRAGRLHPWYQGRNRGRTGSPDRTDSGSDEG